MEQNRKFNRVETERSHVYINALGGEPLGDHSHPGYLKCKLVHERGSSVIVPDQIYLEGDPLLWIQPLSFLANMIVKDEEDIRCRFYVDISCGQVVRLEFNDSDLVAALEDGSQLFRCRIIGPEDLPTYATGTARLQDGSKPYLDLFHHTTEGARSGILSSQHFRLSAWNIQGNKKLTNVGYAYFTCLDEIKFDGDLTQIAMASDGVIHLMRDDFVQPPYLGPDWKTRYKDDILELKVYRESTPNRTATIRCSVAASDLGPQHILAHQPRASAVYYQICCPFIYRVGVELGNVLDLNTTSMEVGSEKLKRFDYIVIGDATSLEGLKAPYDEENTAQVFKIERVPEGQSILDFWMTQSNRDHFSGKKTELQGFGPDESKGVALRAGLLRASLSLRSCGQLRSLHIPNAKAHERRRFAPPDRLGPGLEPRRL